MNFNWQDFDETKIDFHALTLCRKRSSSFQNFYSFYVRISTQNVFTFVKKSNRDFVFQSSCLTSHFTLFSSRTHSSVYFVPCNCHLSLFPFNSLYGFIICLLFFLLSFVFIHFTMFLRFVGVRSTHSIWFFLFLYCSIVSHSIWFGQCASSFPITVYFLYTYIVYILSGCLLSQIWFVFIRN